MNLSKLPKEPITIYVYENGKPVKREITAYKVDDFFYVHKEFDVKGGKEGSEKDKKFNWVLTYLPEGSTVFYVKYKKDLSQVVKNLGKIKRLVQAQVRHNNHIKMQTKDTGIKSYSLTEQAIEADRVLNELFQEFDPARISISSIP